MIFVESSLLLELDLGQRRADQARASLAAPDQNVASWLLAVEVPVVLRRIASSGSLDPESLEALLVRFDADLPGLGPLAPLLASLVTFGSAAVAPVPIHIGLPERSS